MKLKYLDLDHHGKDKLLRLVGDRYSKDKDILTITADRCPLSMQNLDYCNYLLTVLYNESMVSSKLFCCISVRCNKNCEVHISTC